MASVEIGGIRSLIAIPVLKDKTIVGALTIYRREVRTFTEKHIQLVTNFATQAAVAIENARLLSELRESLQEQTATSEVLQVITSSPGRAAPAVRGHAGEGRPHRRRHVRQYLPLGRRRCCTLLQRITRRQPSPQARSTFSRMRPAEENTDAQTSAPGRMVRTKSRATPRRRSRDRKPGLF